MNFNEIKELIKTIETSSLTDFELRLNNDYVRMSKTATPEIINKGPFNLKEHSLQKNFVSENIEEPITIIPEEKPIKADGTLITAPIVGVFYDSPSPDKPPFVAVGNSIKKGDTLCIVEAMKVMNEITCDRDGTIAEIFAENEQMVEFGKPLFRIV